MKLILDVKRYLLQFLEVSDLLRLSEVNREWNRLCREPNVWYPKLKNSSLPKRLSWQLFYVKKMMMRYNLDVPDELVPISTIHQDFFLSRIYKLNDSVHTYSFMNSKGYLLMIQSSTLDLKNQEWIGRFRSQQTSNCPEIELFLPLVDLSWIRLRAVLQRAEQLFDSLSLGRSKSDRSEKDHYLFFLSKGIKTDNILQETSLNKMIDTLINGLKSSMMCIDLRYHHLVIERLANRTISSITILYKKIK